MDRFDASPGQRELIVKGPHRGDLTADTIKVTKDGSVLGDIYARVVRVAGRLDGNVKAAEFYAARSARVRGTIRSPIVGIMPGATFAGMIEPSGLTPADAHQQAVMARPPSAAPRPSLSVLDDVLAKVEVDLASAIASDRAPRPRPVVMGRRPLPSLLP